MRATQLAEEDLARSGLTMQDASAAGMYAVADAAAVHPDFASAPALVIPYLDPWTGAAVTYGPQASPFVRVRYLEGAPSRSNGNPFKPAKVQRYAQPPHSGVHAYFPPVGEHAWAGICEDPEWPLVITEGEKKAAKATLEGFACIGLGGVYNFYTEGHFLPELERIAWNGRAVYICYDSDAVDNPDVRAAEARLASELSMKRGAVVHMVRIPAGKSGAKQGLDDYIVAKGPEEFEKLLLSAPRMRGIDAAVISMNENVAWIEKEGLVYDLRTKEFIQKANFTKGSAYSAVELLAPTARGDGVKRVSVAEEWLTHPHAQRYDYVVFQPEIPDPIVQTDTGGYALNMWTGWSPKEGDVTPFLELSEFLFEDLGKDSDLPLRLLAYKAQNPGKKVPLALVLVGPQGCGKSLWAECARDAFQPYTAEIPSSAIGGQFNGWTERTLIAVINEANEEDVRKKAPELRRLISDKRVQLNEKFRPARQIDSYTQYILTSNERGAGAYSADDRRMIVVSCPPKREDSFYRNVARWKNNGGGAALLHFLLSVDLEGWTPPQSAPMTAEKYMAYMESLTPVERLAEEMRTANHHIVVMWIQQALSWAEAAMLSPNPVQQRYANEVVDSLRTIQIRPWYTPEELALMFPAISSQLHGARGKAAQPSGQISKELRDAGITYLRSADDPRGFRWRGSIRQFLIVAEPEEWTQPLKQSEFERLMGQFEPYGDGKRFKRNGRA